MKDFAKVYRMIEKKVAVLGIICVALVIAVFAVPLVYYSPTIDGLNSQVIGLNSQVIAKQEQMDSKDLQISILNSQVADLQSQISILQSSASSDSIEFQSQIASLQSQLLDASTLIAQLQGPTCLLYTSPSPRDRQRSRMPSSA